MLEGREKPKNHNQQVNEHGVTSYLVASTPEVLSQILKENQDRGLEFNPAFYTTPANALNTTKIDFPQSVEK